MHQPSLFDRLREPVEPPPRNYQRIRAYLRSTLRIMRNAQFMPWDAHEAASWERKFPEYANLLPSEEATAMIAGFEKELARLKAVAD